MKLSTLMDGLRFLVARGAAPTLDKLVSDLATIRQPIHFSARINKLIQKLPLPEMFPPREVGGARRIDDVAQILGLGKRWMNCVATCYLDDVNEGSAAVYLWPHAVPAACAVRRHGRLGWALEDAKGPENAELPPARLEEIYGAFAAVGIARYSEIESLDDLAESCLPPKPRRPRENPEDRDVFEDFEELEAA